MALIKCPKCNQTISSEASNCPHCGFPIKKQEIEKNEYEDIPEEIAIRGEPGFIKGVIIFLFIIGIIFVVLGILLIRFSFLELDSKYFYALAFFGGFIVVIGIISIVSGIQGFVRMGMNSKNTHPCIEYDKESNELNLYKINGEVVTISPDKYISLKDNFFTDNLLYFTYHDNRGRIFKINLGYCANRNEIRAPLEKLRKLNKHR